jgi:hypothetical protein
MNTKMAIESNKKELNSLFKEELELKFANLEHTYSEFKLIAVDGKPLPDNQNIRMYFYRDDIYIPIDNRKPNYRGSLVAYDKGKTQYVAEFFYGVNLKKDESDKKLSIKEVITDLYNNKKRDGRQK